VLVAVPIHARLETVRVMREGGTVAGPFIFVSQSRIKEGRLDDFKRALREMAEFVETNEPRVIGFEAYLDDDETEVTGVQIHPDADSMAFHMQVAFEKIMEFDQYLDTQTVEVYGVPNEAVLGMMKQIADQFGGSGLSLRVRTNPVGGFIRAG
jgi:quinol monooxygenase YgiN